MLVAAGIDPKGMITFFETLAEEGKGMPEFLKYVSTHPSTADRITRLQSLAAQQEGKPVKLLPDYEWKDIHQMCQVTDLKGRPQRP